MIQISNVYVDPILFLTLLIPASIGAAGGYFLSRAVHIFIECFGVSNEG
jgi:hypothetical protein